jgi:hypothetical protein
MSYAHGYGMFVDYSIHFSIQQCLLDWDKMDRQLENCFLTYVCTYAVRYTIYVWQK